MVYRDRRKDGTVLLHGRSGYSRPANPPSVSHEPPDAPTVGQEWVNTSSGNQRRIWTGATWAPASESGGGGGGVELHQVRSDVTSTHAYIGTAEEGIGPTVAMWHVARIHLTDHTTQNATGAWSNRLTLSYS